VVDFCGGVMVDFQVVIWWHVVVLWWSWNLKKNQKNCI